MLDLVLILLPIAVIAVGTIKAWDIETPFSSRLALLAAVLFLLNLARTILVGAGWIVILLNSFSAFMAFWMYRRCVVGEVRQEALNRIRARLREFDPDDPDAA